MPELITYLNGEYVPISQCKVSVMDIGVTTGASVTDMVRTFNQKIMWTGSLPLPKMLI